MARSTASRRSSLTAPPPSSGSALLNARLALGMPECQSSRPVYVVRRGPLAGDNPGRAGPGASHTGSGVRCLPSQREQTRCWPRGPLRLRRTFLDRRTRGRPAPRNVPAEPGLVVEEVDTGWCGAVVRVEKAGGMHVVHLEDRHGRTRGFPLGPGFLVDGEAVVLTPPQRAAARPGRARRAESRTASGSTAVRGQRAAVAAASRLFVEGRHDADLVEKVWGDDLRVEGVVVEMLDGVDDLPRRSRRSGPDPADGWACSSTTSSRAPRSRASSTRSGRCRALAAT